MELKDGLNHPGVSGDSLLCDPGSGAWNAGGNLTNSYYITDAVASQTQAGSTDTWTLDPAGRRRVATLAGTPKTNHYSGSTDSPTWIDEGGTAGTTRYLPDLAGQPAITLTIAATTTTTYNVINIHGDIDLTSSPTPVGNVPDGHGYASDDYGNPYSSIARYTWLGAAQRSNDALAGTTLMGARLYTPTLGRFLTPDPIYGGNENTYNYPNDPINQSDTTGKFCWKCWLVTGIAFVLKQILGRALCISLGAFMPICYGLVSGVVAAASFLLTEIWALGKSFTYAMGVTAAAAFGYGFLDGGMFGSTFKWRDLAWRFIGKLRSGVIGAVNLAARWIGSNKSNLVMFGLSSSLNLILAKAYNVIW